MTTPHSPDDDNSWDELARELGIDELSAKIDAVPVEHEPLAEELGEFEEEGEFETDPGQAEGDAEDGEDAEGDAIEGEADGTDETSGDEQPGTGRKRRRRRRRRRGKGTPGEPGATEAAAASPTESADAESQPEPEPHRFPSRPKAAVHVEAESDEEADELETPGVQLAAEEDTGSEVLRELIATWNVPAWDDIVGGLYRPDR